MDLLFRPNGSTESPDFKVILNPLGDASFVPESGPELDLFPNRAGGSFIMSGQTGSRLLDRAADQIRGNRL